MSGSCALFTAIVTVFQLRLKLNHTPASGLLVCFLWFSEQLDSEDPQPVEMITTAMEMHLKSLKDFFSQNYKDSSIKCLKIIPFH